MTDHVGPVILSNKRARHQFLTRGVVVSFRGGEKRTLGETHARWKRTGRGMADARVEHLGPVSVADTDTLRPFAPLTGFNSPEAWQDAIRELHDDPDGHLYRIVFTGMRDPLSEWLAETDHRTPITLRGVQMVGHSRCDGPEGHRCGRVLEHGAEAIHVTTYGPGSDRDGRRVLCDECYGKQTALDIAEYSSAHPELISVHSDELPGLKERFPDILADVEIDGDSDE